MIEGAAGAFGGAPVGGVEIFGIAGASAEFGTQFSLRKDGIIEVVLPPAK